MPITILIRSINGSSLVVVVAVNSSLALNLFRRSTLSCISAGRVTDCRFQFLNREKIFRSEITGAPLISVAVVIAGLNKEEHRRLYSQFGKSNTSYIPYNIATVFFNIKKALFYRFAILLAFWFGYLKKRLSAGKKERAVSACRT